MTDMAPRAFAEARRRRERVSVIYRAALVNHAAKINGKPADLQAGLKLWLFMLCRDAAHAGLDAPLITREGVARFYRQFLSQVRQARFGPIAHVGAEQWRQQIDGLCEEYGWQWVEHKQAEAA